jgi:hypothetical protein
MSLRSLAPSWRMNVIPW